MKYILIAITMIMAMQYSFAQHRISGNVKDEITRENLIGASVYINDLKTGVSTDLNGNFEFDRINSGSYLVEISLVGYNTSFQRINLVTDTFLTIILNPSVSELNEVVVTAVTRSTEVKQSPVIIKTIDKNALNQTTSTNLVDALKNIPGVNQITTGASISKPIIRGLGYNRVISLYNGIRQEGQQWGDEHGVEIDEYDIDRIEIVKGPGSLMYGSDGIAGVINFISPKAPPAGEIRSQLVSNFQTNNQLVGYSFSNAGNKKGMQWSGRLSHKFAGNYKNKYDGKVYNSGFKELDGSLLAGVNKNWGHSYLNFSTYNSTLNLVEGDRDSSGNFIFLQPDGTETTAAASDLAGYHIGFPHQVIHHLRVSSNNYLLLKTGTLNMDFALQNNLRKEFGDVQHPDETALFFDLYTFNYQLRYNFSEVKGWQTSFGLGGMYQSNANKGAEFIIPAYHLFDAGAFLVTQKTFHNKLILAAGFRFENRNLQSGELILDSLGVPVPALIDGAKLKFPDFTRNFNGLSGSVGISYLMNKKSTLKFNLSRGFRAPTIAELASNGRHEGTFKYEIGSQNLRPETSQQFDIAYFLNSEHIAFELTPFVNFISNYIYSQKLKDANGNDVFPDPADPAPGFQFVQGNATLLGGEIYLDVHPHPFDWLHIENSFSYVQATQDQPTDKTRKYLPFIPAPKYRCELRAQFKRAGNYLSNVYFKAGLDRFFRQDRVFSAYDTETPTPGYTLLNAGLGASISTMKRKDLISLFISGENLANVAYQSHLSRLKYAPENLLTGRTGVYNMGRNVSIKLILNI